MIYQVTLSKSYHFSVPLRNWGKILILYLTDCCQNQVRTLSRKVFSQMQSCVIIFKYGISSVVLFFGGLVLGFFVLGGLVFSFFHMITAQVMLDHDAVSPRFTLCLFQADYTSNAASIPLVYFPSTTSLRCKSHHNVKYCIAATYKTQHTFTVETNAIYKSCSRSMQKAFKKERQHI